MREGWREGTRASGVWEGGSEREEGARAKREGGLDRGREPELRSGPSLAPFLAPLPSSPPSRAKPGNRLVYIYNKNIGLVRTDIWAIPALLTLHLLNFSIFIGPQ